MSRCSVAEEEQELGKKIMARQEVLEKRNKKRVTSAKEKKILQEGLEARN